MIAAIIMAGGEASIPYTDDLTEQDLRLLARGLKNKDLMSQAVEEVEREGQAETQILERKKP